MIIDQMSTPSLQDISSSVEKMSKKEHIEILRIIKEYQSDIAISENSNGCFINMSSIDNYVIDKIQHYIKYCQKKEEELKIQETKKNVLLNSLM
jgi:hypothetical protein